jgi:hypothetical protein
MLKDVKGELKKFFLLAPQVISADTTTAAADLKDVQNFAFLVSVGAAAFSGTDKAALKVTHSDDNSTFVDCVSTDLYSSVSANIAKELVAAGDANALHLIEYRGIKRYVKLTIDIQGSLASAAVAVAGISTELEVQPV